MQALQTSDQDRFASAGSGATRGHRRLDLLHAPLARDSAWSEAAHCYMIAPPVLQRGVDVMSYALFSITVSGMSK